MVWFPEQLDLSIADDYTTRAADTGLRSAGTAADAPGFAQGDEPDLKVTPRPREAELPASETEPSASDAAAEADE